MLVPIEERRRLLCAAIDDRVRNKELVWLACRFLETVPDVFWTAPSSSTGKHHPEFDQGDGGVVRHAVVAMAFAEELCRFYDVTELEHDAVIVATAIHDAFKGGEGPEWTETTKDHGEMAAEKWWEFWIQYESEFQKRLDESDFDDLEDLVTWVRGAVYTHMGIWGNSRYTHDEVFPVQNVVAMADYVSTRKLLNPGAIPSILDGFYFDPEPEGY